MSVDPAAEEQFGPYLVYERLGVGGMATVHRALEQNGEGVERTVALKRLLPHLAEDASFIKSFVREAKLASLLNHLNIVQIYELGRVGTEYFISMEYIDGRDIRRLLRHARKVTGPPPIYVTVGLMLQLCDALDYAHNKVDEDGHPLGLVHRDISPSNLLVTSQGHLKIIDFGIAKAQSSQLRTQTGRVKGKLAYMAPEAISGSRDLDARSDIWATGVILHELCTARPLFASKNEYQTLLKVQKGDILPASTFNQACPPELDAIIFKALARDANDRYANATELRDELVKLKKQYALQTGYRDVAGWIEWAFGLESPSGFSGDTSGVMAINTSQSRLHSKTPRPPKDVEEDEAVEVVWGNNDVESDHGEPVVLEEVPDVSEKVRAKRDTEDERFSVDDIPTPQPSHGVLPSIYGANGQLEIEVLPPTREPRLPPHTVSPSIEPLLARGTDKPMPRGSAQIPAPNRPVTGPLPVTKPVTNAPPMGRPISGPVPVVPRPGQTVQPPMKVSTEAPRAQRPTSPGTVAPSRTRSSDLMPATGVPRSSSDRMPASAPIPLDAPHLGDRMAAQRARDSNAPTNMPTGMRGFGRADSNSPTSADGFSLQTDPDASGYRDMHDSLPRSQPLSEEELFGNDAAEVLRGVSAQIEAMSTHTSMPIGGGISGFENPEPMTTPEIKPMAALPAVPVVRFSKSHSIPPQNVSSLDPMRGSIPQTKPGIAPVAAMTLPRTPSPSRPPANEPAPAAHAPARSKTWLFAVAGLLIAGGTAAIVALTLTGGDDAKAGSAAEPKTEPAPIADLAPARGTVKFVLEPADAEIKLEGKVVHTGSPWSSELAAGIHQIEIHKTGYKSWLTSLELSANETHSMRVVLEPITGEIAANEDATLTIATTPAGLDVYIDGLLFKDKTPIKTTLTVGPHKIAVRQNGIDVWQQNIKAEAASDYEFNPSFTDDKKRERAQRASTPRAAPVAPTPAPAPVPAQAGSADKPAEPAPEAPPPVPPPVDTTPNPNPAGSRPPITVPL